jgi:hypothetical protein
MLIAIRTFASFVAGRSVNIWCDNQAAVNLLNSGRGSDFLLQTLARNLWLLSAKLDCDLHFAHIRGSDNRVADLLSRWEDHPSPTSNLFQLLNQVPIWMECPEEVWNLDLHK